MENYLLLFPVYKPSGIRISYQVVRSNKQTKRRQFIIKHIIKLCILCCGIMCMINLHVGLKFGNLCFVVERHTLVFYIQIIALTQKVSSLQINSNLLNI